MSCNNISCTELMYTFESAYKTVLLRDVTALWGLKGLFQYRVSHRNINLVESSSHIKYLSSVESFLNFARDMALCFVKNYYMI